MRSITPTPCGNGSLDNLIFSQIKNRLGSTLGKTSQLSPWEIHSFHSTNK
jgi:hypothetical protein